MKKRKILFFFLGFLAILWCIWMWMVGFNTGKYTANETPFNVPGRIIKSMREGAAMSDKKAQLNENFEKLMVGYTAPDFSLPALQNGETIALSDFRGKTILLEFWASWCGDCRRQSGHLWDLYDTYKGKDFEIIGISMDRSLRSWKKAVGQDQLSWPQACDGQGVDSKVMLDYGVFSLPRNYLLDRNGVIIGKDMSIKAIREWLQENG